MSPEITRLNSVNEAADLIKASMLDLLLLLLVLRLSFPPYLPDPLLVGADFSLVFLTREEGNNER